MEAYLFVLPMALKLLLMRTPDNRMHLLISKLLSLQSFSLLAASLLIPTSLTSAAVESEIHATATIVGCVARLDHSFRPSPLINVPLYLNKRVQAFVRPGDKVLLAGAISAQDGILRLLPGGQQDPSFTPFFVPEYFNYSQM